MRTKIMRQLSIFTALDRDGSTPRRGQPLECFDIFCGAGGFSEGARQAGHEVVFACDSDANAIATHKRNHPSAVHMQLELPAEIPFPVDGRPFHVHGSPPCQQFSTMNTLGRTMERKGNSISLIEWYLELALNSGATSWSMEQVSSGGVRRIVEQIRMKYPGKMAWAVFKLEELGVPQTRKRLIAGSPHIIAKLLQLQAKTNKRSVADVLDVGRATHIRNAKAWISTRLQFDNERTYELFTGRAPHTACTKRVTLPSPTVLTSCYLRWVWWEDGTPMYKHLTVAECMVLQTFPPDYKFPSKPVLAKKQIGNALPPLVAKLWMS